ncbi:MAG: Cof-type HAD-IIB family hydrolase [Bariatricus sp.]|nr:Cof-type HAD-IIB family hydrolase [Bariatricus sp.]
MGQALFFDIDGTILSEITKKIPDSTYRALERAKKNGHLLFINSGRTRCALPRMIEEMPFDGYLCGCGIYLTYNNEVFYEKHLPVEKANAIAKMAKTCQIDGVFEGSDDVYFSKATSRFSDLEKLKLRMRERGMGKTRYLEDGDCHFDKMYVVTDDSSDKERFFEYIKDDMDLIDREGGAYECVPKGCSKATAIQMVLDKFHLAREQSYVFGDSANDLPMFQYAGHGIAMEIHSHTLEPYTEFVTKTVEEDGIEYALKRFGLI